MYARLLYGGDRPDGAGQLAFEGADVIDVLNKVGGAETLEAAIGKPRFGNANSGGMMPTTS